VIEPRREEGASYRLQAGEGVLVPQPNGGALRPGGDGVSGGRRSKAVVARLEKVREVALEALEKPNGVMSNPGHKNFPRLFQIVHEAIDGKPEVRGAKEPAPTQVQVIVINGQQIAF
jgi:hypothetical protein